MIDAKAIKEYAEIDPAGLAELLLEQSPEEITEVYYAIHGKDLDPKMLEMFIAAKKANPSNGN